MAARKRVVEPKETAAPRPGRRGPKADVGKQKAAWLAAFRNVGTVRTACQRTNVPRGTVNGWLDEDATFVAGYDLAWEDFVDSILDSMIALARGTIAVNRKKRPPNFTALVATLNAFHDDFKTMGTEAVEKKLAQALDVIHAVAQKYIAPADYEKFTRECDEAGTEALLGVKRKARRE